MSEKVGDAAPFAEIARRRTFSLVTICRFNAAPLISALRYLLLATRFLIEFRLSARSDFSLGLLAARSFRVSVFSISPDDLVTMRAYQISLSSLSEILVTPAVMFHLSRRECYGRLPNIYQVYSHKYSYFSLTVSQIISTFRTLYSNVDSLN